MILDRRRLLHDLRLQIRAVKMPLGVIGLCLVQHSVHDIHRGHYRFDLPAVLTSRLRLVAPIFTTVEDWAN